MTPLDIMMLGRAGPRAVAGPPLTNLAAWYRKGIGINDTAGAVNTWADQSGNGRDLTQTGTARPTLQGDGTLLLDGVDDCMQTSSFTLNQPVSLYMRFKAITWTNADQLCDGLTTLSMIVQQNTSSPTLIAYAGSVLGITSLSLGTWGSLGVVFNSTSSVTQLGNNTPTTGDAGSANPGGFALGRRAASTFFGNFQVAEILIYSAAHDQATRDQVIAYLDTL